MEELAKLEVERGNPRYGETGSNENCGTELTAGVGQKGRVASNEMCTFLILNISSLQLIPVNMIAYRSQYGSVRDYCAGYCGDGREHGCGSGVLQNKGQEAESVRSLRICFA